MPLKVAGKNAATEQALNSTTHPPNNTLYLGVLYIELKRQGLTKIVLNRTFRPDSFTKLIVSYVLDIQSRRRCFLPSESTNVPG